MLRFLPGRDHYQTTPCSRCKSDMYTLRYMRSMPSTSKVTCSRRTSATVRGTLIAGSGRHMGFEPATASGGQLETASADLVIGSTGAFSTNAVSTCLVGLRRSLGSLSLLPGRKNMGP